MKRLLLSLVLLLGINLAWAQEYKMAGPYEVVARDGQYRSSKDGSERDMKAALTLAQAGKTTEALAIINAYAHTLQRLDGHDAPLCTIQGYDLVRAMTMLRDHKTPEWDAMLRRVFLPTIQRFDALFAKLAQNPAMETIDSLLPLPQTPRLQLAESSSRGIYHLTLWLPKDARRDGHYKIRAFEYNTGTKLGIDGFHSKDVIVLEHALVMVQPDFAVYTGDWGQYYGSRWQVWFVPNQGEKELVCEQLFLMQGWMR